uniref:Ig-like domain-containing protein n=1 Tax=Chrysemys picta bellii TaxID=8478 RepID=A0A8C3IHL3_CHRPI
VVSLALVGEWCLVVGGESGLLAELPITARFGGDVTLSCLFPSQPGMNLQRLTLTWNRTWLDPEGLARGNASLTLRGVRMQDEGIYRCHITSELGITSDTRQVTVTQTGRFLPEQTGIAGNAACEYYGVPVGVGWGSEGRYPETLASSQGSSV